MISEEKIKAICEAFEKYEAELEKTESIEDAVALLKSKGVEVTADEFQQLADAIAKNGELDENALESVAGGNLVQFAYTAYKGYKIIRSIITKLKNK